MNSWTEKKNDWRINLPLTLTILFFTPYLYPNLDTIRRHKPCTFSFSPKTLLHLYLRVQHWSTLVQVMACCLTAPSHYLNQCWLIISTVLWHSSEDIIITIFEDTNQQSKIENYIFKITSRSPTGQWVKTSIWCDNCILNYPCPDFSNGLAEPRSLRHGWVIISYSIVDVVIYPCFKFNAGSANVS